MDILADNVFSDNHLALIEKCEQEKDYKKRLTMWLEGVDDQS